MNSFKGQKLGK